MATRTSYWESRYGRKTSEMQSRSSWQIGIEFRDWRAKKQSIWRCAPKSSNERSAERFIHWWCMTRRDSWADWVSFDEFSCSRWCLFDVIALFHVSFARSLLIRSVTPLCVLFVQMFIRKYLWTQSMALLPVHDELAEAGIGGWCLLLCGPFCSSMFVLVIAVPSNHSRLTQFQFVLFFLFLLGSWFVRSVLFHSLFISPLQRLFCGRPFLQMLGLSHGGLDHFLEVANRRSKWGLLDLLAVRPRPLPFML